MVSDRDIKKAMRNISTILHKHIVRNEIDSKDVIFQIEAIAQSVEMGGVVLIHKFEFEIENDVGDVIKSKNESDYGRLLPAGVRRIVNRIFAD